jgi:hypothetical protein
VCPLFCQGIRGSQADSASAACYQRYLSPCVARSPCRV